MEADKELSLLQLKRAVALRKLKQKQASTLKKNSYPKISSIPREKSIKVSMSQQRLWFLCAGFDFRQHDGYRGNKKSCRQNGRFCSSHK